MDLTEQAHEAAIRVLRSSGLTTSDSAMLSLMKLSWLDGFRAGMAVTKAHADEAFANLERAL